MEELWKLARKGRPEEVERAWMQALTAEPLAWQELLDAAEALADRGKKELAESLLWYLIVELKERDDPQAAFEVAARGGVFLPGSMVLRDEASELYLALSADPATAEAMADMTLGDGSAPLDVALKRLDILRKLIPGAYVRVDPGAKFGRVEGFDPDKCKLVVAFADGSVEYDAASAEGLEMAGEGDFRALVVFERGRLEDLARDDPEQLITLVLNTFGPRVQHLRLQRHLQSLLGGMTWARWWGRVKRIIEQSATIGMSSGGKPDLFLRSRPMSPSERLRGEFDVASPQEKFALVFRAIQHPPQDVEERLELFAHFAQRLASLAASSAESAPGIALSCLAVLDTVAREAPDVEMPSSALPEGWFEGLDVVQVLCDDLARGPMLRPVMEVIPRWLPGRWCDVFSRAIPHLPQDACSRAARSMADADRWDAIHTAALATLDDREPHPGALTWLWRASASQRLPAALGEMDLLTLLRRLLAAAASVGRAGTVEHREKRLLLGRVRDAVLEDDQAGLRLTLDGAGDKDVIVLLSLVERNTGMTPAARSDMAKAIRACRPELFRSVILRWEENVIYTTVEGQTKREEELNYIANERLPEVIREIGEAASFGDLSENAEYTAALEERGRLADRTAAIQEELARARPITREMADGPTVTVGSRVRARCLESGEEETLTFLGPWDADPPGGIYHYKAPLSLAFMGHAVGDTVTFRRQDVERQWEVLEVSPAL